MTSSSGHRVPPVVPSKIVAVGIRKFEQRVENLVEGTFAKLFRTGVRPVEVARRLTREMDQNRTVGVSGATMAPNDFDVVLSPSDFTEFSEVRSALSRELVTVVIEHAEDEGYTFLGPIRVGFVEDPKRSTGSFSIGSRLREGASSSHDNAYLTLPDGTELDLDATTLVVGRMAECEVTINDPNIVVVTPRSKKSRRVGSWSTKARPTVRWRTVDGSNDTA